jgi:hypothetical protein
MALINGVDYGGHHPAGTKCLIAFCGLDDQSTRDYLATIPRYPGWGIPSVVSANQPVAYAVWLVWCSALTLAGIQKAIDEGIVYVIPNHTGTKYKTEPMWPEPWQDPPPDPADL